MTLEDSFDGFVRSRQTVLLRSAWLLAGNWRDAQDLVQAALEKSWPHWAKLPEQPMQMAYVRRAMFTSFLAGRRRSAPEIPLSDQLPHPVQQPYEHADTRSDLITAIRRLPSRQRAVVALRYFEDLTEQQTAEALGCSKGAVKKHASRALDALRRDSRLATSISQEIAQ